jgi:hypothetical protein
MHATPRRRCFPRHVMANITCILGDETQLLERSHVMIRISSAERHYYSGCQASYIENDARSAGNTKTPGTSPNQTAEEVPRRLEGFLGFQLLQIQTEGANDLHTTYLVGMLQGWCQHQLTHPCPVVHWTSLGSMYVHQ